MLKRDYLVKQFEEFGKVIAEIIGLKHKGHYPDMGEEIRNAAAKYTSLEIAFVESQENEGLIALLAETHQLNDGQLKMLADLLFEKAELYVATDASEESSRNCYRKACLLYRFLKAHATLNYSLDMHYKLEILSRMGF